MARQTEFKTHINDGLVKLSPDQPQGMIEEILNAIQQFQRRTEQTDDFRILMVPLNRSRP